MSGWETPSRPTWDPQDGPEDSTQAFPSNDSAAGDRWVPSASAGWDDGQDAGRVDQQPGFFSQDFEQRRPGATLAGRGVPGPGRYQTGPQVSARDEPPWPGPGRQESNRQESARPDYGRGDNGRSGDNGRTGEYGRPDFGPNDDFGRNDFDRPNTSDEGLPRRGQGRADSNGYATFSGQPDQAGQAQPPMNRAEAERAARMDPALADFFAPTKPDPRYTAAGRPAQSPGLPGGPGPSGPRQSGPMRSLPGQDPRRGAGTGPRRPARPKGAWEDPTATGSGRRIEDREPAGRRKMIAAIVAVLVVAAAGGGYLVLHKSNGGGNNAAGATTPTPHASNSFSASAKSPAAKGTAGATSPAVTGSASAAGAYVLSTPSTAAGYPIGTDPHFLATAESTVAAFEQSGVANGAGTVSGSPIGASYTLPDQQTIEFVGYQGTFDPTKVMANLKSYGSSEMSYPAGPNGGDLACANTTATASTPSGAVCVWVTKSTLGFTEFFTQANGPEALNTAQSKGAEDTVNLRASVEKLKS